MGFAENEIGGGNRRGKFGAGGAIDGKAENIRRDFSEEKDRDVRRGRERLQFDEGRGERVLRAGMSRANLLGRVS